MLGWERKALVANLALGILLAGAVLKAGRFVDETKYQLGVRDARDAYIIKVLSAPPKESKSHRRRHHAYLPRRGS